MLLGAVGRLRLIAVARCRGTSLLVTHAKLRRTHVGALTVRGECESELYEMRT